MKKLMTSLALTVLIAGSAAAQAPGREQKTPEERAQQQTELMTKHLGLTPEQVPQVKAINLKYVDRFSELRGRPRGEESGKKEAVKDLREQRNAELKAVLTPEQYDRMIKGQAERQDKRQEQRKQRKADQ
ncbi:MAG: hypothetical protein JST66_12095 [Bacteroidetes bacterium]|nr:hypothetical protein [Bacteroidota bacterium]